MSYFSHTFALLSFCYLCPFPNCLFTTSIVTKMPFGFRYCPVQLVTCYQIASSIMIKIISTKDRLFMSISGSSGSGTTDLIFQMLLRANLYPSYNRYFFYVHNQPKYCSFVSQHKFDNEIIELSSFENDNSSWDCLIVFDKTCKKILVKEISLN